MTNKSKKKQQGATMITWLLGIGVFVLMISAAVKIVPYYIEFNSVKGMMKNIAGERGIDKAGMRQINNKISKYLDVNSLAALEYAYYNSRSTTKASKRTKNPFSLSRLRKSNKRILTVEYQVPKPWIANLSFLMDFKYAVVLGHPDEVVKIKNDPKGRKTQKLSLN